MIGGGQNLDLALRRFKTVYTDAPVDWDKVAMKAASAARSEDYGWLGQFPELREWLGGERVVKDLAAHGFTLTNRNAGTVSIRREDIASGRLGVFTPVLAEMGHRARQHPDELIFPMLADGFTSLCLGGQPYFDAEHPAKDADGNAVLVSNVQEGTDPAWFLQGTSRAIKPLIFQERETYDLQTLTNVGDVRVFMTDVFLYGVRARVAH